MGLSECLLTYLLTYGPERVHFMYAEGMHMGGMRVGGMRVGGMLEDTAVMLAMRNLIWQDHMFGRCRQAGGCTHAVG